MQISLKLIQSRNYAKKSIYIKFQLLVTFSYLFTGSSSLSVFPRGVLYLFTKTGVKLRKYGSQVNELLRRLVEHISSQRRIEYMRLWWATGGSVEICNITL